MILIYISFMGCRRPYSHAQLSVVEDILQRVEARIHVGDLRTIGDHTWGGVHWHNKTRDVHILNIGELRKLSGPSYIDGLLKVTVSRPLIFKFIERTILNAISRNTLNALLQDVREASFREKLNFNTGGSTVKSATPWQSLLVWLLRIIRDSLKLAL